MKELKREKYLSRIRPFYRDCDIIKVLTGVRRSGKSTIMRQIMAEINSDIADARALVYVDLDSKANLKINTPDLLEELINSFPAQNTIPSMSNHHFSNAIPS